MKRFQMLLLLLLIFFAGSVFISIDNNSHNVSSYKERPASHARGLYLPAGGYHALYGSLKRISGFVKKKASFRRGGSLTAASSCPVRMLPDSLPPGAFRKVQSSFSPDRQPLGFYDFHAPDLDHSPGRWKKAFSFV